MNLETFFEKFELLADAPDAVARLRELVLQLAVSGSLVKQNPKDVPAFKQIQKANKSVIEFSSDESIPTPDGWCAVPLGCVVASNTGGGTPSKQNPAYWNGAIPWASVKDVQNKKYLTSTIDSISEAGLRNSSSNLIPPGRLVVVTRMGLGKLAINTTAIAINQDLRAIEPTSALHIDYAYLLFKSLKMIGSGMTVKGITVDKLHAMPVIVPPLAEQKRIVAKVDELMAVCDRLDAQLQERQARHADLARASLSRFAEAPTPASLDFLFHNSYDIAPADLRKSILTLAVRGKLVPQDSSDEVAGDSSRAESGFARGHVDLPSTWALAQLSAVAEEIVDCPHSTPKWTSSGKICVRTSQFKPGFLDLSETRFVSRETFQERVQRLRPQKNDILYSREGGILGVACRVPPNVELCLGQRMMLIRAGRHLDPAYLELVLNAPLITELARRKTTGGAAPRVNVSTVKAYPIPVPPLTEQRRIVAKVKELMALVDQLEAQLAAARASAGQLLDAVVAELTVRA